MQQLAQQERAADSSQLAMYARFLERCREHLHVVISLSPVGDSFRDYLRSLPALISCCTIDWFTVRLPTVLVREPYN